MTKDNTPEFDVEKVRELMEEYRAAESPAERDRIEEEVVKTTVKQHFYTDDTWTPFAELSDEEVFWKRWEIENANHRYSRLLEEIQERGFLINIGFGSGRPNEEWVREMVDEHGLEFFRRD